jgi:hypothetical protein
MSDAVSESLRMVIAIFGDLLFWWFDYGSQRSAWFDTTALSQTGVFRTFLKM